MKKAAWLLLLASFLLIFPVSADTGPKPSLRITFEDLSGATCYGTILTKENTPSPDLLEREESEALQKAREAFMAYKDKDGFRFEEHVIACVSETGSLSWTYYPPEKFKILLYFPETNSFAVSEICERYAFDSYYTVSMAGTHMASVAYDENRSTDERIEAERAYYYRHELIGLCARILITLAVEMAVAFAFGFREKKMLLLILIINILTQLLLNLSLNLLYYGGGAEAFVIGYVLWETVVFSVEAVFYTLYFGKRAPERKKYFYVVYALIANGASLLVGICLAPFFPTLF